MKNAKHKTLKQLAAGILVGAACLLTPMKSDAQELSWYRNFSLGIDYEAPVIKRIDNVPAEIRNLPSEYGYSNLAPIQDDDVEMYGRLSVLKGKLGGKLDLGKSVNLKLGAALDWEFDAISQFDLYKGRKDTGTRDPNSISSYSANKALKNIDTRMKCESGSSGGSCSRDENLDYYYVHPSFMADWNTMFRPSAFSELEFKLSESKSLALGCEVYNQDISARTGYSRPSGDNVKDECKLATLTVARPYASFRISCDKNVYAGFDLGLSRVVGKSFTELGKQADFELNDAAISAGIRVGVDF